MGMKFVNLPKAKRFHITTRFYDERKEAMREREERIRRETAENNGEPVSSYGASIKGSFRTAGTRVNSRTIADARRKSNMRLLYIIIILLGILYFLMK
jgi:hypothetical protein